MRGPRGFPSCHSLASIQDHNYNISLVSVTYCNMDKPWGHYTTWNKPITKGKTPQDSTHEVSKVVRIIEAEKRKLLTKQGLGEGKLVFRGHWVSVLKDENILEIYHTTMWIDFTLLNYTLRNSYNGSYHNLTPLAFGPHLEVTCMTVWRCSE